MPLLLAHYMAWFASKPARGAWGWHWTMDRFDPEKIDPAGRRAIASHAYPLLGPYDSGDPDLLECHALWMKFAGIDGVVIDWYGIDDFRDYAAIHHNVERLIPCLKKAGLRFAVCYEDQAIRHQIEGKALAQGDDVARGRATLAWLERNWFADRAYIRLGGRPALLVFGPQHFGREAWAQVVAGRDPRPIVFGLPHLAREAGLDGAFAWPPVSGGKEIAPSAWREYLHALYARREPVVAGAFPGFHDIYREAGLHESYGFIDARGSETLVDTLALAENSGARLIQIATWNDFGEGTAIEPTREEGYRRGQGTEERGQDRAHARGGLSLPGSDPEAPQALAVSSRRPALADTALPAAEIGGPGSRAGAGGGAPLRRTMRGSTSAIGTVELPGDNRHDRYRSLRIRPPGVCRDPADAHARRGSEARGGDRCAGGPRAGADRPAAAQREPLGADLP